MYYELKEQTVVTTVAMIPADVAEFIQQLVRGTPTTKIPAIKAVRTITGWGLKESKYTVDNIVSGNYKTEYDGGRCLSAHIII